MHDIKSVGNKEESLIEAIPMLLLRNEYIATDEDLSIVLLPNTSISLKDSNEDPVH